jgi:hypothetical protein
MPDVVTQAKRSAVMSRIRSRGNRETERAATCRWCDSEFTEVELVAGQGEIVTDVGDDAARDIARMPGESDEAVGPKRIRVMAVAAGSPKEFAADFAQAAIELPAVVAGEPAHGSGNQNEFLAESGRDRASGFEQRFQMRLGGLLKAQGCFTAVASMGVAARQERRSGDPHAVFILSKLHLRKRNNHDGETLAALGLSVKGDG